MNLNSIFLITINVIILTSNELLQFCQLQYGYFILNPPSNSETTNRNGMNFKPLIEELKCPPFTKFGVKRMIGLVTVHVLRFCSYLAAAVESADRF